ncbi:transmembrane protein 179B [Ictalurus furcatus]|uniref:transmembrane protein 179B n=1 Tax=Ictalurus furcatus TaxID=66913 RepID=UPI002350AC7D|nr:transmembrane protein 179B [Ictalurus furcatus]XP_053505174.1 transmembrane protein 179B [Ictalurus furcatus]
MMGLPWLLALELVLHAGSFMCGVITAASVTITQGHFTGQCILYGSIYFNTSDQSLTIERSSPPSVCYFVSAISVCVAIYCFAIILYWIYASCVDDYVKRRSVCLNVSLGVCVLLLLFHLVSGCILRVGRDSLCLSVLHNNSSISSCKEAQNMTWSSPYIGSEFYTELHSAEKSVWVSFFFWLLVVAVVVVQRRRALSEEDQWSCDETEPFLHRPARVL